MQVNAFLDESGKAKDRRVISLACVADYAHRLSGFDETWRGLLRRNGLKALSAKNILNHNKPFSAINPAFGVSARLEVILPFIQCIRRNLQVVTGIAVDAEEFRKLPQSFFQVYGSDPLYMCFARTLLQICEFADDPDKISLVYDEDAETLWDLYQLYRRVKKVWPQARRKIRALTFADDSYVFILQASDLIGAIIRLEVESKLKQAKYDYYGLYEALLAQPTRDERLMYLGLATAGRDNLLKTAEDIAIGWKKWEQEKRKEDSEEQRVRELQRDKDSANESSPRRDKGQTGRRRKAKKAKA